MSLLISSDNIKGFFNRFLQNNLISESTFRNYYAYESNNKRDFAITNDIIINMASPFLTLLQVFFKGNVYTHQDEQNLKHQSLDFISKFKQSLYIKPDLKQRLTKIELLRTRFNCIEENLFYYSTQNPDSYVLSFAIPKTLQFNPGEKEEALMKLKAIVYSSTGGQVRIPEHLVDDNHKKVIDYFWSEINMTIKDLQKGYAMVPDNFQFVLRFKPLLYKFTQYITRAADGHKYVNDQRLLSRPFEYYKDLEKNQITNIEAVAYIGLYEYHTTHNNVDPYKMTIWKENIMQYIQYSAYGSTLLIRSEYFQTLNEKFLEAKTWFDSYKVKSRGGRNCRRLISLRDKSCMPKT